MIDFIHHDKLHHLILNSFLNRPNSFCVSEISTTLKKFLYCDRIINKLLYLYFLIMLCLQKFYVFIKEY